MKQRSLDLGDDTLVYQIGGQGPLIVFEESSHALQLEEPVKFREAVAAFVEG